jgi:hypothetical protein
MALGWNIYFVGVLMSFLYAIYYVRDENNKLTTFELIACTIAAAFSWVGVLGMFIGHYLDTGDESIMDNGNSDIDSDNIFK